MDLENLQYDLLKTELKMAQKQMDKYDDTSVKIQTWAVTLWIASIGWSFQTKNPAILKFSIFALVLFWILDLINKVYRQDYKKRREEVGGMLSDLSEGKKIEGKIMKFPEHSMKDVLTHIFTLHRGFLYWILIIISLVLSLNFFN